MSDLHRVGDSQLSMTASACAVMASAMGQMLCMGLFWWWCILVCEKEFSCRGREGYEGCGGSGASWWMPAGLYSFRGWRSRG